MPSSHRALPQQPGEQSFPVTYHKPEQHHRQQLLADFVLSTAASLSTIYRRRDRTAVDRGEEVLQWLATTGNVRLVEVYRRLFSGRLECVLARQYRQPAGSQQAMAGTELVNFRYSVRPSVQLQLRSALWAGTGIPG